MRRTEIQVDHCICQHHSTTSNSLAALVSPPRVHLTATPVCWRPMPTLVRSPTPASGRLLPMASAPERRVTHRQPTYVPLHCTARIGHDRALRPNENFIGNDRSQGRADVAQGCARSHEIFRPVPPSLAAPTSTKIRRKARRPVIRDCLRSTRTGPQPSGRFHLRLSTRPDPKWSFEAERSGRSGDR